MNELNVQKINKYYELFDDACMLLYDRCGLNYLEDFIRVYDDIRSNKINSKSLGDEDLEKLAEIYDEINSMDILNEEVREALVLIIVKGLKHVHYPLDGATPDTIIYLYAILISNLNFSKNNLNVLELDAYFTNLINGLSNNIDLDCTLYAIEENFVYSRVGEAFSNLQDNDVKIYCNNPLDKNIGMYDVIIGNIEAKETKDGHFYPYDIILKYTEQLNDKGYMILLIDNNFFGNKNIMEFKNKFMGTILGLIVLPEELFKNMSKSILIISPEKRKDFDMMVSNLPPFHEKEKLENALQKLKRWLRLL